jgi:hypothetical protein
MSSEDKLKLALPRIGKGLMAVAGPEYLCNFPGRNFTIIK